MLVPVTVQDVMTEDVETATPTDTARASATRMAAANVGSLVICEGDKPVGIVTESDLVRLLAREADVDAITLGEFMTADLVVIDPEATVERAADLLQEGDIRRLPVAEHGALVGIVTATDLSYYLPRVLRRHAGGGATGDLQFRVRPDTTYDEADWAFESRTVSRDSPSVGDVVEFSKELSDEDVRRFAHASGDTNRLHLDEEYAAQTRFGRRIVHGTLVSGVVSAALARLPGLTIYLSQEVSFLGPVDIGTRVRAVCEIVEDLDDDKFLLSTNVFAGPDGGGDAPGAGDGDREDDGEKVIDGEAAVLVDDLPESAQVELEELQQ